MLPSFQQPQEEGSSNVHVMSQSEADKRNNAPTQGTGTEPLPSSRAGAREAAQDTLPVLATTGRGLSFVTWQMPGKCTKA